MSSYGENSCCKYGVENCVRSLDNWYELEVVRRDKEKDFSPDELFFEFRRNVPPNRVAFFWACRKCAVELSLEIQLVKLRQGLMDA
jgi:hypothetical protein